MRTQESGLYLRRCDRCSNFMDWLVSPYDGTARCLDCGKWHPPREFPLDITSDIPTQLIGSSKEEGK